MLPLLLAGLLYLGSGLGLGVLLLVRRASGHGVDTDGQGYAIPKKEVAWLLSAILAGGEVGPALLMAGQASTEAASALLLLNVEGVLTAVIASVVFRENADRQIVIGMVAIVAGGVSLSVQPGAVTFSPGALLILGACLAWAVDNNLTRKVSANDALLVACLKGLLAGACNTGLALLGGAHLPGVKPLGWTLLVGFAGYGLSLALFVVGIERFGNGSHWRILFRRAALWRRHRVWHLAGAPALNVLAGRCTDGNRGLAAPARAARARPHPSDVGTRPSAQARRAPPARARVRLGRPGTARPPTPAHGDDASARALPLHPSSASTLTFERRRAEAPLCAGLAGDLQQRFNYRS